MWSVFNGDTGEIYFQNTSKDVCEFIALEIKKRYGDLNIWII